MLSSHFHVFPQEDCTGVYRESLLDCTLYPHPENPAVRLHPAFQFPETPLVLEMKNLLVCSSLLQDVSVVFKHRIANTMTAVKVSQLESVWCLPSLVP